MARPIPDMDQMTAVQVATDDSIIIDDTSAGETKRINVGDLLGLPKMGWTSAGQVWTFSSFNSATRIGVVTVPSNATTKYSVGMRAQFVQATGGTKYGFIVAVSATTLSIFFGAGITLNNEAISTPYYSTEYMPFGYTGPMLTKEGYQSDVSNSERWVYELSGWGVVQNVASAALTEGVAYGITFASIALVVVEFAGDNSVNGGYGTGGNLVEGRVHAKSGSQSTTGFAIWLHQGAGANFAAGYSYYTWVARGPVA